VGKADGADSKENPMHGKTLIQQPKRMPGQALGRHLQAGVCYGIHSSTKTDKYKFITSIWLLWICGKPLIK
jgi:hypothetical protein